MTNTENDLIYSGFPVSRYNLKSYMQEAQANKKGFGKRHQYNWYLNCGIMHSIIDSIAANDAQFNPKDTELCDLLEQMIVKYGVDVDGVYTPKAHAAMRNLCIARGQNPDSHVLYDNTISGRFKHAKAKIGKLFGGGRHAESTAKPVVTKAPINPTPAHSVVHQPQTTTQRTVSQEKRLAAIDAKIAKIQHTANSADQVKKLRQQRNTIRNKIAAAQTIDTHTQSSKPQTAKSKTKSFFGFGKKNPSRQPGGKNKTLYRMTVMLTGLMTLGGIMFVSSDTGKVANTADKAPTFKTISASRTSHNMSQTYDLNSRLQPQYQITPMTNTVVKNAPTATDRAAQQLTRTSKSALDILLGVQQSNDLCARVQNQIDAGIFAAPDGMSVERIAHAMTMSRIYEGSSIILSALQSKVKLTPAEQAEFNRYITDEIGDMGIKVQQRMVAKQKLSSHNMFAQAPQQLQKQHIENLRQLKKLQELAKTR